MMNESNLEVVRAGWDELPGFAKWDLGEVYKAKPEEYRVYADMRKGRRVLYVHEDVPEKDVAGFAGIAACMDEAFLNPDKGTARFMDYVYETYGSAAYFTLKNAQRLAVREYMENKAREKVEAALPEIRRMMEDDICDEYVIAAAFNAGLESSRDIPNRICSRRSLYVYCMGYMAGLAASGKAAGAAV